MQGKIGPNRKRVGRTGGKRHASTEQHKDKKDESHPCILKINHEVSSAAFSHNLDSG